MINKFCYFDCQFVDDVRVLIRREKVLFLLVDLLGQDRDDIVCYLVFVLRNLVIDDNNKVLIGKQIGIMLLVYVCIEIINNIQGF